VPEPQLVWPIRITDTEEMRAVLLLLGVDVKAAPAATVRYLFDHLYRMLIESDEVA
jgi:hypothetical protein